MEDRQEVDGVVPSKSVKPPICPLDYTDHDLGLLRCAPEATLPFLPMVLIKLTGDGDLYCGAGCQEKHG